MICSIKKVFVFACVATALSPFAEAQRRMPAAPGDSLSYKAMSVANLIQQNSRYLSPAQRQQVDGLLDAITGVVYSNPGQQATVTCVSRDNDGNNPYVMAVRQGVTDTKISGTVFSSKQTCETAITKIKYKAGLPFLCATRDNDGNNPFVLSVINYADATLNTFNKSLVFSSNEACLKAINDSIESQGGVTLCSSKDNDGNNPYSMYFIDNNQSLSKGTERYNNYDSCKSNLR